MGRTRGKQPASIGIGKVHKTMDGNALVFRDATSSIDNLIARAQDNPLALSLADVILEEPGHAIEGENWRPQLAPINPGCTMRPWTRLTSLMAPTATC